MTVGGPRAYGAGGYTDTPLEETLPGRHGRPRPREAARRRARRGHRQVGLDGRLPLQQLRRRHGRRRRPGIGGRQEDRHRQGGDPAGRVRADRRATSSASWRSTSRRTGSSRRRRWAASRTCRARSSAITPDGQTNIFAGLDQAVQSLKDAKATRRHIILLTDGWSSSGQYDDILEQMKAAGITLSTVGAGGGVEPVPRAAGRNGGGRFYAADEPGVDPRHLPQGDPAGLGPADRRGEVLPDPDLAVADPARASRAGCPRCSGYNGTTAKPAAQTVLVTARDDPLLAQWQYGLGRSVAWTSDSTGRWAKSWIGWDGLLEVLQPDGGLDVPGRGERRHRGRRSSIAAGGRSCGSRASNPDGSPRDFYSTHVALVGPGPRAGRRSTSRRSRRACTRRRSTSLESGAYAVRVTQTKPGSAALGRTLGLVAPTAAEYRLLGANEPLLGAIRAATGGEEARAAGRRPGSHDLRATSRYTDTVAAAAGPGAAPVAARHRAAARLAGPRASSRTGDAGSATGSTGRRVAARTDDVREHARGARSGRVVRGALRDPARGRGRPAGRAGAPVAVGGARGRRLRRPAARAAPRRARPAPRRAPPPPPAAAPPRRPPPPPPAPPRPAPPPARVLGARRARRAPSAPPPPAAPGDARRPRRHARPAPRGQAPHPLLTVRRPRRGASAAPRPGTGASLRSMTSPSRRPPVARGRASGRWSSGPRDAARRLRDDLDDPPARHAHRLSGPHRAAQRGRDQGPRLGVGRPRVRRPRPRQDAIRFAAWGLDQAEPVDACTCTSSGTATPGSATGRPSGRARPTFVTDPGDVRAGRAVAVRRGRPGPVGARSSRPSLRPTLEARPAPAADAGRRRARAPARTRPPPPGPHPGPPHPDRRGHGRVLRRTAPDPTAPDRDPDPPPRYRVTTGPSIGAAVRRNARAMELSTRTRRADRHRPRGHPRRRIRLRGPRGGRPRSRDPRAPRGPARGPGAGRRGAVDARSRRSPPRTDLVAPRPIVAALPPADLVPTRSPSRPPTEATGPDDEARERAERQAEREAEERRERREPEAASAKAAREAARPRGPGRAADAQRAHGATGDRDGGGKARTSPRAPDYRGRNHVWIPSLGISKSVEWFPCARQREPDNYMYRWGCAGANNVYLMGHAYSVMKPLHDAYVNGRLSKGMKVWYADSNSRVHGSTRSAGGRSPGRPRTPPGPGRRRTCPR